MSEMSTENVREEELRRLLLQGAGGEPLGDASIESALRGANPEEAMQYIQMLNPDQQNLVPGPLQNPSSFGEGMKNIGTNLATRFKERIGYNPSYERRIAEQKMAGLNIDQTIKIREANRKVNLKKYVSLNTTIDPELIKTYSDATLNSIMEDMQGDTEYFPGVGYGQKNLNTNMINILGKNSDELNAYDRYVKDIEAKNKNLKGPQKAFRIPSFQEYKDEQTVKENYPASVKEFEYWKTMNPGLVDEMSPKQLVDTFQDYTSNPSLSYIKDREEIEYTANLPGGVNLTPGQLKTDQDYAPLFNQFVEMGTQAEFRRDIGEINDMTAFLLDAGPDEQISGRGVALLKETLRTADSLNIEQKIGRIVVKGLRATMGAAFTDEEGKRFIGYAYNVMLPPKVNAMRMGRLRNAMEEAFKLKLAKHDYYQKEGTLKGFKGLAPNKYDIYDATFRVSDYRYLDDSELDRELMRVREDSNGIDAEFEVLMKAADERGIYEKKD